MYPLSEIDLYSTLQIYANSNQTTQLHIVDKSKLHNLQSELSVAGPIFRGSDALRRVGYLIAEPHFRGQAVANSIPPRIAVRLSLSLFIL